MAMKPATKGALILVGIGVVAVLAIFFLKPLFFEKQQIKTSDAKGAVETIRFGGDDYGGYALIQAQQTKQNLSRRGLAVSFPNDGGAYAERLQKFADGEYDMIVLPVKEYLTHGEDHKFPGVIVAGIAESRGADGVVGYGDRIISGKVEDLNDSSLRIGYIPDSPNEFLLTLMIEDFDLFNLKNDNSWRVEFDSPQEVYDALKNQELDFAVLWDPLLYKATQEIPGVQDFWGSDKFGGYIVDVFVVNRKYLSRNERQVRTFFQTYFQTLDWYANPAREAQLIKDLKTVMDLKKYSDQQVKELIKRLDWYDLHENCSKMFGVATNPDDVVDEGVINTIWSCMDIMVRSGETDHDPIQDPYLIVNSDILSDLLANMPTLRGQAGGNVAIDFEPMSDDEWEQQREIGTMRVEPINFQQSSNWLTPDGKELVDKIKDMLTRNYPNYRVCVRGHTGSGGDEEANIKLSLERAQVVVQRLTVVLGVDPDRLHAEGYGSKQKPPRKPGESGRVYNHRLSRVEFVLIENNAF